MVDLVAKGEPEIVRPVILVIKSLTIIYLRRLPCCLRKGVSKECIGFMQFSLKEELGTVTKTCYRDDIIFPSGI